MHRLTLHGQRVLDRICRNVHITGAVTYCTCTRYDIPHIFCLSVLPASSTVQGVVVLATLVSKSETIYDQWSGEPDLVCMPGSIHLQPLFDVQLRHQEHDLIFRDSPRLLSYIPTTRKRV